MAEEIPARIVNLSAGSFLDLPGTFSAINISNPLKMDRARGAGKGSEVKQAQGYSDYRVDLSLDLAGDDALSDLEKIQDFYRPQGADSATPAVFLVVCEETVAMRVGKLLWTDVSVDRSNWDDVLRVRLPFEEVNASDAAGAGGTDGETDADGEGAYDGNDYVDWITNSQDGQPDAY